MSEEKRQELRLECIRISQYILPTFRVVGKEPESLTMPERVELVLEASEKLYNWVLEK